MITDIFILGTTSNFKNFDNYFQKYNIKPTIYINIPKFYKSNYYFHLFEYQKYKNCCDNFIHSVFNIINILIKY